MSPRPLIRSGAIAAAASLALLAAGPALAAAPVAQGSAQALSLSIAGNTPDTGSYSATNDGTTETVSGNNQPLVTALGGQSLIQAGTLAQDVKTGVSGGDGVTDACAGLAGPGASLVGAGNGQSCLTGGQVLTLQPATVDLSGLSVLSAGGISLFQGVDTTIAGLIATPVQNALAPLISQLDNLPVNLSLRAVTSSCHATPGVGTGAAQIAGAALSIDGGPLGTLTIANLPVNPTPNLEPVTNLSGLVTALQNGLSTELTSLGGSSSPLLSIPGLSALLAGVSGGLDTVLNAVKANLLDVLGPQLAPLQDNILDLTLNRQTSSGVGQITVQALDLGVLPAAQQFVGFDLAHVTIGTSSCGPNSRVGITPPPSDNNPTGVNAVAAASTPNAVKSGIGSLEDAPSALAMAGLAGLAIAGASAGVIGFRRSLHQH